MTARYVFGHVKNCGAITYGTYASFPNDPINPPNNWYNLKIEVRDNKNVKVYLNGVYKVQFTANFNTRGYGGVAIANGYSTTMQFRDFLISPIN